MTTWQADFFRRPLHDPHGKPLWELVICDAAEVRSIAWCSQPEANSVWLTAQLKQAATDLPDRIQVFRPQSVSLLEAACRPLGIAVEPTRHTPTLKKLLQARAREYAAMPGYTGQSYDPIALDQPPPLPLPDNLWGEQWRFAAIAASELEPVFRGRAIPILSMPESRLPIRLQIASTTPIPGVVIDGGRRSMVLAQWLQSIAPVALRYVPGQPDGLILEAGLVDRWVLATFDDAEMMRAARSFGDRLISSQGVHFLLVQPDDSGKTYSGFWLLQAETFNGEVGTFNPHPQLLT
ncbi:MAG: DUF1092 family protein [Leptolyngbyaceae cyanobacterium SL_7_1]|nr:DUF1092 family protein [Leptolyngbyaceae cyanobacterium SL_7_1]